MSENKHLPLVAIVANYPKGTGYAWWLMERYWHEISCAANENNWRSIVIYPETTADAKRSPTRNLSSLEKFLSRGTLRDVIKIYLLIHHLNVRSLYLTDRPFFSWKYLVLRLSGIRSIVVHDHTPGDRPQITGFKGLLKYLINSTPWITASLVVAISPLMRQRQLLNARIPSYRIATVTNGIIVRDLVTNARDSLLNKFGLAQDSYVVCTVGRLNPYKRFDFAIKCIGKLAEENPECNPVLILIGDGPDRQRLEGIAEEQLQICEIIFAGQVEDVWSILCGADTVMHPSAGEGLSLAILEAMAAACAVVVPNLPSVYQTIEHGVTGLIYQNGSLDNAKKMLHTLATNNVLRITLGRTARQTVVEQYQLERAVKDFHITVIPTLFGRS